MAAIEVDLVVAGSGAAGGGAAVAGAALGMQVLMLEKAATLGGATAASLGGLWVPENHLMAEAGLSDDRAAARDYLRFLGAGYAVPAMAEAYLDHAAAALRFFADAGIGFRLLRRLPDHYYPGAAGTTADGRMVEAAPIRRADLGPWGDLIDQGVHNVGGVSWGDIVSFGGMGAQHSWPWEEIERRSREGLLGAGPALVGQCVARLLALGGRIEAGVRVERLIMEDGRVVGVEARRGSELMTVRARRGVVLATGGYEGNAELVGRLEGLPDWMNIFTPETEGDGMVMGTEQGGAVWRVPNNLAMLVGYAMPRPATGPGAGTGEAFFSVGLRGLSYPHGLVVNDAAQRFCDESQFQHVVSAFCRFDMQRHRHPNLPAWFLFDSAYLRRYPFAAKPAGSPPPDWLARADSIPALAAAIGVDPTALVATIERFNANATRGEDPDFGRGSSAFARSTAGDASAAHPNLGPLSEPPYFACRLRVGGISAAGLLTDPDGRVQHVRGRPIEGLYACGNATAPTEQGAGYQAGMSLMRGMIFGWRAARHAAGRN